VALVELSAVNFRFVVTTSDVGVELFVVSLSGVAERRLLATCGNFLPLPGDITSPLSVSCPTLELLHRGINPRAALLPCSVDVVSAVDAELLAPSVFVVEPLCRLAAPVSPDAADCLAAARLMDPGVDGAGIDVDDDDDLADFTLELLEAAAAGTALLALRLSGWALELTRRARPERRAPGAAPLVVELLAMLLILVDDAVRLGTDDDGDRLPSYITPASSPPPGSWSINISLG